MSERKSGPPPSGEIGLYNCRGTTYPTVVVLEWDGRNWKQLRQEEDAYPLVRFQTAVPLHDYPLVPGEGAAQRGTCATCKHLILSDPSVGFHYGHGCAHHGSIRLLVRTLDVLGCTGHEPREAKDGADSDR